MILDQVFFGVLNESEGTLEVYDEPVEDVSGVIISRNCTVAMADTAAPAKDRAGHDQADGRRGQEFV
jgi:hypothetical protein